MTANTNFLHPYRWLAALALAALAGCSGSGEHAVDAVVIASAAAPYAGGVRLNPASALVRSASSEGLVAFDEQGRVVPALADRWIVTDDGMSYIFRLRDGTWPDGATISGESARDALQQALAANAGTALGLDLGMIDEVRAMAGRVVEIRLKTQMPDLLQLLAQPELGLLRGGRGSGPMKLTRRKPNALLAPIAPEDRGLPQIADWKAQVRNLRLTPTSGAHAVERFNDGRAQIVLGGRFEDFPRLDAAGVSRGAIRLDPVAGLFGLAVVHGDGFLSRPENREALAMAIDRDAVAASLGVGGWTQTTRIVGPGMAGDSGTIAERWPGRSVDERRAVAAARVADWRGSGHKIAPLRIALPEGPGADALFATLATALKAINLEATQVDQNDDADLRLVDVVARYARPAWFLHQLSCRAALGLCDSSADRIAAKALSEPDAEKRAELEAQAEAQLTLTNAFLPLGVPVRWTLVSGDTTGFAINRWNQHPLMTLVALPR